MRLKKNRPRRALAWLLALIMVLSLLPVSVFADESDGTAFSNIITAFEPLDELTVKQYWGVGTSIDQLILPEALAVTVTVTSGAALTVTLTEDIAVTDWQSEPKFIQDTFGTYIFTPTLDLREGYSVAAGVEPPRISVEINALMSGGALVSGSALSMMILPMTLLEDNDYTLFYNTIDGKLHQGGIDGPEVDSVEGLSYSGSGTTLTLSGFVFETTAAKALIMPAGSKLDLASGSINSISSAYEGEDETYGIYSEGALEVSGTGEIMLKGSEAAKNSFGFYVNGDFTMNGGTVYAWGNAGSAVVEGNVPSGICIKNKGINGAYTIASKFSDDSPKEIVESSVNTIVARNVEITVGAPADPDYTLYFGMGTEGWSLYADADQTIKYSGNDGKWTADENVLEINDFEFETSARIGLVLTEEATITLKGESRISGGDSSAETVGILSIENCTLEITGDGKLNVTAGSAGGIAIDDKIVPSSGIQTFGDLTINEGTLIVSSGNSTLGSYGIECNGTFKISGGQTQVIASAHTEGDFATQAFSQAPQVTGDYKHKTSTDPDGDYTFWLIQPLDPMFIYGKPYIDMKMCESADYTLYYNKNDSKIYTDAGFASDKQIDIYNFIGSGNELTLIGLKFETTSTNGGIVVPKDVTITLIGENAVTAKNGVGIFTTGDGVSFIGTGTIAVTGTTYGISGKTVLKGGTVVAIGDTQAYDILPGFIGSYEYKTNTDTSEPGGVWTIGEAAPLDITGKKYVAVKSGGDANVTYTLYYDSNNGTLYRNGIVAGNEITLAGISGSGNILTLNNFEFNTSASTALVVPNDTVIVINGISSIYSGKSTIKETCGIKAEGDLTIQGDGMLNIFAGNVNADVPSNAIYGNGDITITGGAVVNATGGTASQIFGGNGAGVSNGIFSEGHKIKIESGATVTAEGGNATWLSSGISGSTIDINGATVTALSKTTTAYSDGLSANSIVIENNSVVTARAGEIDSTDVPIFYNSSIFCQELIIENSTVIAESGDSVADSVGIIVIKNPSKPIYSGDLKINNSTVRAISGGGSQLGNAVGIRVVNGEILIENSDVTAIGQDCMVRSAGMRTEIEGLATEATNNITINNSIITSTGGKTTHDQGNSMGIDSLGEIEITGNSHVIASGGDCESSTASIGIHSFKKDITIDGSEAIIIATGSNAKKSSSGIRSEEGSVSINCATLTAIGNTVSDNETFASAGIWLASSSETITVNGGVVMAKGKTYAFLKVVDNSFEICVPIINSYMYKTGDYNDNLSNLNWAQGPLADFTPKQIALATDDSILDVSFNANGGSGNKAPVKTTKNAGYILPENPFTREGYSFTGWRVNNMGNILSAGSSILISGSIVLYAQWNPDIETVTVSFDTNGGTGSMLPVQVIKGGSYFLPASVFTRSGYSFTGWKINNVGITHAVGYEIANVQSGFTLFAQWASNGGGDIGGGGENVGSGGSTQAPTSTSKVNVIIDGKEYSFGKVEIRGNNTYIIIAQTELEKLITAAHDSIVIQIASITTDSLSVELPVRCIDEITNKGITLTLQTGGISYILPAGVIDAKSIIEKLNAESADDVYVSISITVKLDAKTQALVDKVFRAINGESIILAIQFSITAEYNGKVITINTFDAYTARTLEITEEQAKFITTAVVVEPDGTVRHVPTRVYWKDNKWYVEINSRINSTYVLINSVKSFTDFKGKWYESAADEMAERKIMAGMGNNMFEGERNITRAEFAAIFVNALGLSASGNASVFSDVIKSAWYCKAVGTAYEYGLINGRGDGTFDPNAYITWQEAMTMIVNASKMTGFKLSYDSFAAYSDADAVSEWAYDAVSYYVGSKLFMYESVLRPTDYITRAETAAAVLDLLRKAKLIDDRS